MKILHDGKVYNSIDEIKEDETNKQDKQNKQPMIIQCLVYCLSIRAYTVKHY